MSAETPKIIVSLTSFPAAMPYAVKAIQSILKGSVLPDKLVLYLFSGEFNGGVIPENLVRLSKENPIFEVRFYNRNLRSYLKLIPALKDFPESIIVTVDDDINYHKNMLRDLLELHKRVPNTVIAHRAKLIKPGEPYRHWRKYRWYHFVLKRNNSGLSNLQTGVAGVLYPPHSLKKEMLDEDIFMAIAPTTDDVWFWAAATANNVPVMPVPFGHNKPKSLNKPKKLSLKTDNFKGKIDRNLAALNAILEHYPEIHP